MTDGQIIERATALVAHLELNASGCDTGGADWAPLARALRRRAGQLRKAIATRSIISIARLTTRPLTTGDAIPSEYHVTDSDIE